MLPVLFSIGKFSVSSFGVFLALGFLLGIFLVWRLSRAWDLDEEKILDLTLLTSLGGLLGSRIYFVIENLQVFTASPLNFFLINKAPGFSFWGGILGGWLALFFLSKRFKVDFWQFADIASVGLLGGLVLSELGCFFGGCNVGVPSKSFFAVSMVGIMERRWPVQLLEAAFLTLALMKVWAQATHFHQRGKIVSLTFIYIGAVKLILEPLKGDHSTIIFQVILILLGLTIYYKVTNTNPTKQLKDLGKVLTGFVSDPAARRKGLQNLGKSWYNRKTNIIWKLRNLKKSLRRANVKLS